MPTVSITLTYPYENTIALGGEAAGSMKANEAARAEGNIRYRGFWFKPMACKRITIQNFNITKNKPFVYIFLQ